MDSNPENWQRNLTPKTFINPLGSSVEIHHLDDENIPHTYSIPPFKPVTYPSYLADFLILHLVDAVINERKLGYLTPEKRAEIAAEIENIL